MRHTIYIYISNMRYSFCVPVCVVVVGGGVGGGGGRDRGTRNTISRLDQINWGLMYPFC